MHFADVAQGLRKHVCSKLVVRKELSFTSVEKECAVVWIVDRHSPQLFPTVLFVPGR